MRDFRAPAFLSLILSASACSLPASAESTRATTSPLATSASPATITFGADWTDSASQPLVAGAAVTIAYDPARLPTCRGDLSTGPGWSISAFYQVNGGAVSSVTVAGEGLANSSPPATFVLPAAGDLAMWFQVTSVWGCDAYDSSFGANYHFAIAASANAPGWMGNASSLIDRATCPGPCYADAQSADAGFTYGTWARQQAAITALFFDVWKQGITDFDNPDLWQELDVEMHSRIGATGAFATSYVSFATYVGNNARYAVNLRPIDPLPGQNDGAITDKSLCPTFPTTTSADGQYIQADLELYFTVNGAELRPADGTVFHGLIQNYAGLYAICGAAAQ
jgi:hypothetical protein